MKILFHSNQLGIRGTEVAMYDYANWAEKLWGATAYIVGGKNSKFTHPDGIKQFSERFKGRVYLYDDFKEAAHYANSVSPDLCYLIKGGKDDGKLFPNFRNVVHSVFAHCEPHGDVYAYVSRWLADKVSEGMLPFVPHMIDVEETVEDLRSFLGIPQDATVFGRIGGLDTMGILANNWEYLKAFKQILDDFPSAYFIFVNSPRFIKHDRVIFVPTIVDRTEKAQFINTCDVHLHLREDGETFGIAIGEFSVKNKPVITPGHAIVSRHHSGGNFNHFQILGDTALYFNSPGEFYDQLAICVERKENLGKANWNKFQDYSPEKVMEQFKKVFVDV